MSDTFPEEISTDALKRPSDITFGQQAATHALSKIICIMLEERGVSCSSEYLVFITELCSMYLNDVTTSLHKLTENQRRHNPTLLDTYLCINDRGIDPPDLHIELQRGKDLSAKGTEAILRIEEQILKYSSSITPILQNFSEESDAIEDLVPRSRPRPSYIPHHLPAFPPDYTYQQTPKFNDVLDDPKILRTRLVGESRMTEKLLYKLIDDEELQWKAELEEQLKIESMARPLKAGPDGTITQSPKAVEISIENSTDSADSVKPESIDRSQPKDASQAFDIEAFALSRRKILQRREEKLRERRQLRQADVYMQAERYFSPYAQNAATKQTKETFAHIAEEEFKRVLLSVRAAEIEKKRRMEEKMSERAKADRESLEQRNKINFGFNFDRNHHTLDGESSDLDLEPFFEPEFNDVHTVETGDSTSDSNHAGRGIPIIMNTSPEPEVAT